jgi:hypothetical protein
MFFDARSNKRSFAEVDSDSEASDDNGSDGDSDAGLGVDEIKTPEEELAVLIKASHDRLKACDDLFKACDDSLEATEEDPSVKVYAKLKELEQKWYESTKIDTIVTADTVKRAKEALAVMYKVLEDDLKAARLMMKKKFEDERKRLKIK